MLTGNAYVYVDSRYMALVTGQKNCKFQQYNRKTS